jgi:hypothetical protein
VLCFLRAALVETTDAVVERQDKLITGVHNKAGQRREALEETKRRPTAVVVLRPEPPAVRLDDRARDRQAHAYTIRLGGEKGIEAVRELVGGDAVVAVSSARPPPAPTPARSIGPCSSMTTRCSLVLDESIPDATSGRRRRILFNWVDERGEEDKARFWKQETGIELSRATLDRRVM